MLIRPLTLQDRGDTLYFLLVQIDVPYACVYLSCFEKHITFLTSCMPIAFLMVYCVNVAVEVCLQFDLVIADC